MAIIDAIKAKAKTNIKTIALPETEDERTYHAAAQVLKEGTAKIILIGNTDEVKAKTAELKLDLSACKIVDPANFEKLDEYVATLTELRKAKGMTEEKARELLTTDRLTFGDDA